MNKLVSLLGIAATLFFAGNIKSATVYYQPSLYPTKKFDGSKMSEDVKVIHMVGGWFNSSFNKTLVQDEKLQIGGWGGTYTSPLKFDLTGLPSVVDNVYLYLYSIPSGAANPSQVSLWPITSSWSPSTVGWNAFPQVTSGYYWPVSTARNSWRGYWITPFYNNWKNGTCPDNGILIWPYNNDGSQRSDRFISQQSVAPSDGALSPRPMLRFDFTPTLDLRIPLQGNHRWVVTTEVGGYDCYGNPQDMAHTGNNYFSIDFSWRNVPDVGATVYTEASNIPVLAATSGRVITVGLDGNHPNGYYVVLRHNGGNLEADTGFTTRYLHLKGPPLPSLGSLVVMGQTLGYMGNSGRLADGTPTSNGTHLHFGVRYNNSGAGSVSELTRVLMDGRLLKSYQTECRVNSETGIPEWPPIRNYRSFNRVP